MRGGSGGTSFSGTGRGAGGLPFEEEEEEEEEEELGLGGTGGKFRNARGGEEAMDGKGTSTKLVELVVFLGLGGLAGTL